MSKTKASQAEDTRRALMRAGRRLFARRGFASVSAEEIVAAAKVTRGALYHHFDGGKDGLFREVLAEAMGEIKASLATAGAQARAPLEAVENGVRAFLAACAAPEYRQILLIDGPSVLGWSAWRALDLQNGLGLLRRGLQAAVEAQELAPLDVDMATHLIAGAVIDGAMLVGQSPEDTSVRPRVEATVLRLMRGLAADGRSSRRHSG